MRQSIVHVALVVRDYDEAIEFMFLPRGSRYVAMLEPRAGISQRLRRNPTYPLTAEEQK
jgi:catechol 2,3-dioxygenase-like lactoylglutathione lyase family enzyme